MNTPPPDRHEASLEAIHLIRLCSVGPAQYQPSPEAVEEWQGVEPDAFLEEVRGTEPQPDWRPLEPGEIIQEGDEYKKKIGAWKSGWEACVDSVGSTPTVFPSLEFRTGRPKPEPITDETEEKGFWECSRCNEQVPPTHVTYAEHHDGGCGGACEWVDITPEPQLMSTDTPETDAHNSRWVIWVENGLGERPRWDTFARGLERRLIEAERRCSAFSHCFDVQTERADAYAGQLAAAQAEAKEYKEALEMILANMQRIDAIPWGNDGDGGVSDFAEDSHAIARAALAKYQPTTTPE